MKNWLRAKTIRPFVVIEVRTYRWTEPECHISEVSGYHVCRLLNRMAYSQNKIRWRLPAEEVLREAAQFSVLPPRTAIRIEAEPGEATFLNCIFPARHFEQEIQISEWTNDLTASFLGSHNPFVENVLDRLAKEIIHPRLRSDALVDSLVTSLTIDIANQVAPTRNGQSALKARPANAAEPMGWGTGKLAPWQLQRIQDIGEGLTGGPTVSLALLARSCAISPRHLARGFKATTGGTLHNYIRRLRIERAKRLLISTGLSLKEIAAEAGFGGASHFAADFRHAVGRSPSDYRKQMRSEQEVVN